MTSFLSRIATDATSALNDAYSHVMHGDDAGSSAKVVWVVHPTRVPSEVGMGSDGVERFTHKFGEYIFISSECSYLIHQSPHWNLAQRDVIFRLYLISAQPNMYVNVIRFGVNIPRNQ